MLQVSARALLSASLLGTTILGAGGLAAPVFAQSAEIERPYDIPAGSLAEALNRFAAQSGVQLSYEASLAGDLRSEAVRGRMTQSEVLSRLAAWRRGLGSSRTREGFCHIEWRCVVAV